MFSKACEYGIRASIYIADQSQQGRRVNLKDIAKSIGSPEAFTAKILQQLARNNVVNSLKGPNGGFEIERSKLSEVKLGDVVSAIDGDVYFKGCGLGLAECDAEKPCPLHFKLVKVRNELKDVLENTTIQQLTKGLKKELTWLRL